MTNRTANEISAEEIPGEIRFTYKGGVPGGHYIIANPRKETHVPTMRECNSIKLRHSDVVVDIGAYCGTYAIACARFPVKKVVAYEPTPYSFRVLSRTKLPNLESVRAAVVAGEGRDEVELFISPGIGVTNSLVPSSSKMSFKVPAVSYLDAVRDATVVKIDVEGAEYGFPIVQPGLRAIIIDFHPVPGRDWVEMANRVVADVQDAGFRPVISPRWDNGWMRAGSWIRDAPDDGSGFRPMLDGEICCGCGAELEGPRTRTRTVCRRCAPRWSKKFRKTYAPERGGR